MTTAGFYVSHKRLQFGACSLTKINPTDLCLAFCHGKWSRVSPFKFFLQDYINSLFVYSKLLQSKIEFYSDWERGVSGTVGRGDVHHVLNDFAMKLTALVKAGAHTGYLCDVKHEHDKETRYSAISSLLRVGLVVTSVATN